MLMRVLVACLFVGLFASGFYVGQYKMLPLADSRSVVLEFSEQPEVPKQPEQLILIASTSLLEDVIEEPVLATAQLQSVVTPFPDDQRVVVDRSASIAEPEVTVDLPVIIDRTQSSTVMSRAETALAAGSEAEALAEPVVESELAVDTKLEADAEPVVESELAVDTKLEADAEPVVESELVVDTKLEADTELETDAKADVRVEAATRDTSTAEKKLTKDLEHQLLIVDRLRTRIADLEWETLVLQSDLLARDIELANVRSELSRQHSAQPDVYNITNVPVGGYVVATPSNTRATSSSSNATSELDKSKAERPSSNPEEGEARFFGPAPDRDEDHTYFENDKQPQEDQ